MEAPSVPTTFEANIKGIRFALATRQEICKASISDCPISHASQLTNPFLGLPLETGKCESCGTGEAGQCEGHFGYIELPTPIYHPDHVSELKKMLSLLCLKCLKFKNRKVKSVGVIEKMMSSCCEASWTKQQFSRPYARVLKRLLSLPLNKIRRHPPFSSSLSSLSHFNLILQSMRYLQTSYLYCS